jgi:N-acetylglucosamine-6-phosphate deacetylase
MRQLEGCLLTPTGFVVGQIDFTDTIDAVRGEPVTPEPVTSKPVTPEAVTSEAVTFTLPPEVTRVILPGFIDTHVHGGGGGDTMDGAQGVRTLAKFHAQHGTTTLYPTTITNPWDKILLALEGVKQVQGEPGLPAMPGVHLEGPFINPNKLGAQPPFALTATQAKLEQLLAYDVIRLITLAPEMDGARLAAEVLARAGIRISFGHTLATFQDAQTSAQIIRQAGGTLGYTHLYNAMTPLSSREPGMVGAALADKNAFAELIFDTHHVHPASMLAAFYAKTDRLLFITDSIRASGQPDGESDLGGQRVLVKNGAARLANGTLAGSVLTLDVALRNAIAAGLTLWQASLALSQVPAAYMGLADRGQLVTGKRADFVVLDAALVVQETIVAGETVYQAS